MSTKEQRKLPVRVINGVLISLLVATLLLSVLRFITEPRNRDRCQGMLNEGKWVSNEFKEWEPSGCLPIVYTEKEMGTCLTNQRILYIGDSIMREQYFAMISLMGKSKPKKHADHDDQHIFIKDKNIALDLWWDPFINTSKTVDLLQGKHVDQKPTLLIIGSGPWYMKNLRDAYYSPWKQAIDRVFDGVSKYSIADRVLVSPVEIVEEDKLTPLRKSTITHEKAVIMNSYLRERESQLSSTANTQFAIPFAWNEIVTTSTNQTDDGLHFKLPVTVQQAQLALNYRCNNGPSIKTVAYPYDTTCCYIYPEPAWYQTSILFYILFVVPLGVILYHLPSNAVIEFVRPVFPSTLETLSALFIFGLGLIYMFIGDRSHVFGKMQKHFDVSTFTFLHLTALLVGAMTLTTSSDSVGFLNRDQTDEWKGWMQLSILMYHFVGGSRVAGIYNPIRVLVAAYLFQTGYGHFFFFYKKADFGVGRFLHVVVRMNLLTCILCYLMKTDYLFYYFSPLVTFWFCVIWVTMRIVPSHNKNSWFVLAKIAVMSVLTSAIIHVPGVLEASFRVLAYLFKIQWDVTDWRFRLALDAWVVYVGMVCALVTIKCGEYKVSTKFVRAWIFCKWTACILSVLGLVSYFMLELQLTKSSYTAYHPYISWVPILSFVVLRNASHLGRSTYSRFFAFVGKFSLEAYVGQFHMWLAADTRGLLVVLPNTTWVLESAIGWCVNLAISTAIFFFVCYYLSHSTGVLTKWICPRAPTQSAVSSDAVPLLPTTKVEENEALLDHSPAQLQVGRTSEESAIDLEDTWDESMMKNQSTSWYESILKNDWIRFFVGLVLLGVLNRFC